MVLSSFTKRLNAEFDELDPEGKGSLNYLSFGELLQNIGCIKEFEITRSPNRVKELWKKLGGEVSDSLSYDCILNALSEILLIQSNKKFGNELHKKFYDFFTTYLATGKGRYNMNKQNNSPKKVFNLTQKLDSIERGKDIILYRMCNIAL